MTVPAAPLERPFFWDKPLHSLAENALGQLRACGPPETGTGARSMMEY
jgi:hypothetical protein